MMAAAPRRFMKSSTEPLNAFLTARSALIVAVAYFAPAKAESPLPCTPAALAFWAKSCFHCSKPAAELPQLAACAALLKKAKADDPTAIKDVHSAYNALLVS